MRKLSAFIQVSLDGYYADQNGDMSWAHKHDPEWTAFAADNAKGGGSLLFGRVTYEMMASFWPTPAAQQMNPAVADGMNRMTKYVVSRTLDSVDWNNTTLLRGDLVEKVRKLKQQPGDDIATLGSGSVVAQLAAAGLIDDLQIVINPLILGQGKKLFEGVPSPIQLQRTSCREFANGNIVLNYQPA